MYCSDVFENELKGDFYSSDFQYFEVKIDACIAPKYDNCADEEDVWKFFERNDLQFIFKETYYDYEQQE